MDVPGADGPIEILDADVLIIGGGFAGTWAALRASEFTENVVLVDKAYVSRSGASTLSGGVTTCPLDSDDLSAWEEEFISRGDYMCDQRWTEKLLEGQRDRVRDYEEWGVPITRNDDGSIRRFSSRGMIVVRAMQYQPKAAMRFLRQRVTDRGVRIVDRICITELITADGKWPTDEGIVGAVGFNVYDGKFVALRAKRTILATGMIAMKGMHRVDNDTGDGVAMAYRAGARLVDMEFTFGGTFNVLLKNYDFPSYNVAVAHGARLINANGERFMAKYDAERFERSELSHVIAAFAKELIDGRGPVSVDLRQMSESYWADLASLHRGGAALLSDHVPDPKVHPLPIEPTWGLWAGGRTGLHIDIGCRTSVTGLLAAGASAKNTATGTHASAGSPTAFAKVSGWTAGETAAREAANCAMPDLPMDAVRALRARALEPLARSGNSATADQLHDDLARLESSVLDGMILNPERLQRFLAVTDEVREASLVARASDLHDLVKLHEARNVADCAGTVYRSALDRTESREGFYREDFPETDPDWFCWHGIRLTDQGVQFDRTGIPLGNARLKPPALKGGLGPIAAILRGEWERAAHG